MTDVIKIAQDKRAKKLAQIEELMGEVEELEEFISFGKSLTNADDGDSKADHKSSDDENKAATFAAE